MGDGIEGLVKVNIYVAGRLLKTAGHNGVNMVRWPVIFDAPKLGGMEEGVFRAQDGEMTSYMGDN